MTPDLFRPPIIPNLNTLIRSDEIMAGIADPDWLRDPRWIAIVNPPWASGIAKLMPRVPDVFSATYRFPPTPYAGVDFVPPARK